MVAFIARYLGVDDFGKLAYIQSFVALFMALATLGMDGLVVKALVTNSSAFRAILATAFTLRLAGAVSMISAIALVSVIILKDELYHLIIIASLTSLFQAFFVFDYYFQAHVMGRISAKIKFVGLLISLLLKVFVIYLDAGLSVLVYIMVIESAVIGILMYLCFLNLRTGFSFRAFDWGIGTNLLMKGWPLILSGFVMAIYMKIDQTMLNWMLQSSDVGIYAAAVKVADGINFLPIIICSSLFPWVLQVQSSQDLFKDRLIAIHSLMIWLALVVITAFSIGGDFVIAALFGDEFSESANVLTIYTWASLIVYVNVSSTLWIISQDMQKYKVLMDIGGAILNILLNVYLIPTYGPIGAAIATVVSYTLTFALAYSIIKPFRKNLRCVLSAIISPQKILRIGSRYE